MITDKTTVQASVRNRIVVILPIYRDVEMTKQCILSALPDVISSEEDLLLAINDCSPDSGMFDMLQAFEEQYPKYFKFLSNETNLGFVKTVNSGLKAASSADVILLNSDVVVAPGWVDRFVKVAAKDKKIGTITPFSNNATICSFPAFLKECELPIGWNVQEIDSIFSLRDLPPVEVPTGVGFCMYIRGACLKEVGYLSYEDFKRGYGEENDLCQRAIKCGWKNVVTSNIFAYHKGGASFTNEKLQLVENAMKTLDKLHPQYHQDVQRFISLDPLRAHRLQRAIDLLRMSSKKICLAISHELGGGVQQHVTELNSYLSVQVHTVTLMPKGGANKACLRLFPDFSADELCFEIEEEYPKLLELLKDIRVSFVHFHHTHGLHPKLWSVPYDLSLNYAMTVHDFYWVNANPTLTNEQGIFDPAMSSSVSNPLYPLPDGINDADWRSSLSPLLNAAKVLIFPSESTKEIFSPYYDNLNRVAVYHPDTNREISSPKFLTTKASPIRIGVIGAIGKEKGADLLEDLASILSKQGVEVILIGYAYKPLLHVTVLGAYDEKLLPNILADNQIDLFLFPARWPETFSYTLSYALANGAPIVAPNLGAFVERLANRENTHLFNHLAPANQIANEIMLFIANDAKNSNQYLDITAAKTPEEFYPREYLNYFGEKEPVEIGQPFFSYAQHHESSAVGLLFREKVLIFLWKIYQKRYFGQIFSVIPFQWKRAVKRFFSKRSIFELLNEYKAR